MRDRLNRKFIEAKFFSPGRWIGIAYFILPPELCKRAIHLAQEGLIGSPKDYLDSIIQDMTDDWRFDSPRINMPITYIEWDNKQVPTICLFSGADGENFSQWLSNFEDWYIPHERQCMREVLEKWGIENLIKESDKNQKSPQ